MVVSFMAVGVLIMLVTASGIFLSDKYKDDTTKKVSFIVGVIIFVCFMYSPAKKLVRNQPTIVLTDDSIVLHVPKQVLIPKNQITEIDIIYVEETGYFLNIKTESENHQTNISWLDKTPAEIKDLIKKYRS